MSYPPPHHGCHHQDQYHHVNDAGYYYGTTQQPPPQQGYNPYIAGGRNTPPPAPLGAPPPPGDAYGYTSIAPAPAQQPGPYYDQQQWSNPGTGTWDPQYAPPQPQQQPYYPPPPPPPPAPAAAAPQPTWYAAPPPPPAAAASQPSAAPPASPPQPTSATLPRRGKKNTFNATQYLLDRGYTEAQLIEAKGEHRQESIGFFAEPEEIIEKAGLASYVFFVFVKFVLVIFFVLMLLEIIIFSVYAAEAKPKFRANASTNATWYSDFFISGFQITQFRLWQALNAIGLVLVILAGPLYYFVLRRIFADDQESTNKFDQLVDDTILRYDNATGAIDVSARYRSFGEIVLRRLGSLVVFIAFVLVQVVVSLFLTQVNSFGSNQPVGTVSVGIAFGVALVAAILNFTFAQVSELTTEFEKHTRLGLAVRYTTLKRVAFMIANLLAVYWAKEYNEQSKTRCVYDILGEQMAIQLIVEMFVVPVVQIGSTIVFNQNFQVLAAITGDIGGDNDELPKFDLTNVYIRVLYKLYLAVMAMCVFPLGAVLSFVSLGADLWVFKLMLFKLCGKPKAMRPMHISVAFAVTLCAVVGIITPFAGAGFVLSGETGRLATKNSCKFPPTT